MVKFKTWIADQNLRIELSNRIQNNVRSLLLVLIIAKQWDVPTKWYLPLIIGYAIVTWLFGYLLDKIKFYKYLEGSYLDRSKTITVLNNIKSGRDSSVTKRKSVASE